MKKQNISGFVGKIIKIYSRRNRQSIINCHIELTYRCNLNCVHCYCNGSESKDRELNTDEWKKIIDDIQKKGCLEICFTGGEPLIREDFLEIYAYAKAKGFLITILTNGILFGKRVIGYLNKYPPSGIEITLNGITKKTYEAITQVHGSFEIVMKNIKELARRNFLLILKANCLKQNRDEIVKIKAFTKELFGNNKNRFKYDILVFPRLNGDTTPCKYRLSPEELLEIRMQDSDMWDEFKRNLCAGIPKLSRKKDYLYHCINLPTTFVINPYGRLKFCQFTEGYSFDLKNNTRSIEDFYNIFPKILNEKFKTNSKCRDCQLRTICYNCPTRAYLETGNKETPVEYYCRLAEAMNKQIDIYKNRNTERR